MKIKFITLCGLGVLLCANVFATDNIQAQKSINNEASSKIMQNKITDPGEAFLAENKTKAGVVTLPDGLQYKIIRVGTGPKPKANNTVSVHYRGTLIDGTEFDSSYKRNEPTSFPVNAVIRGWTEALQLMPVGSMWELYIPANLAYGMQGASPVIGPNQVLIFEVELLKIQK